MEDNNLIGSLAVGLADIDNYLHKSYYENCLKYPLLIPIAGVNPLRDNKYDDYLVLKNMGFYGVKIHPRFSSLNLIENKKHLFNVIKICGEIGLAVLFCTYFNHNGKSIIDNPIDYIEEMAIKCDNTNIMLMHSGYLEFYSYFKRLSHYKNLIFDFSYTLMSIKKNNLCEEIKEVFDNYSSKICIGSDWPEYSHDDLINLLPNYCGHLHQNQINDICHKNLIRLFDEIKRH